MAIQVPANEVIRMLNASGASNYEINAEADQARRGAQWDRAFTLCNQSMATCTEAGLESEYCRALTQMYLGAVYHSMGAADDAASCYNDSHNLLHIIEYEHSRWNEAAACYALGLIAQGEADFESARAHYRRSLRLFGKVLAGDAYPDEKTSLQGYMRLVTERLRQIDLQAGGTATGGLPKNTVELPRESILVGGILQIEAQAFRIKRTFDVGVAAAFQPRLGARYLAVRVDGESMTGADINDNDYVIVREQPRVETGEIAVVLVDDPSGVEDPAGGTSEVRSTVKRFYQQGNRVLLRASNPDFNPQEQPFQAAMIRVLGRVVAVACPKTS